MKKIQNSTYSPLEILPKNDLVFKKILENTSILRAFIADVLGVERTTIQNVELLNTEILPNDYTSKFCRLDVKASIDGSLIDIEIQRYDRKDFVERAIYYLSRLCSSSINQGDDYRKIPKSIIISVMDCNLDVLEGLEFHSEFLLKERKDNRILSEKFNLHFLELKKLPQDIEPKTSLERWLSFFGAESEEEIQVLSSNNDGELVFAINEFHKLQKNSTFRQEILKREEILREEASALASAQNWGIEKGIAIGKVEGIEEGIAIGNAEGRFEEKRETAIELLKLGLSLDQISKGTKLDIKEIKKLKENL